MKDGIKNLGSTDIRNKAVLKSGAGIYVDPSEIEADIKQQNNELVRKYNEKYNHALEAPVPIRRVPFSYILTTAVPPKMKEFSESGLVITNEFDLDPRQIAALKTFSVNVADEQMILLKGNHVDDKDMIPGEVVKLNFSRYRALADGADQSMARTVYNIPQVEINGYPYLLLDSRDVMMVTPVDQINVNNKK